MKRTVTFLLAALLLTGCGRKTVTEITESSLPATLPAAVAQARPYAPRFAEATLIQMSDMGITVEGNEDAVYTSHDIIYYEDKDAYESGNPYGEGTEADTHSAAEAAAHTVVNITQPGAYTVTGTLSAGQIRIDLGEDAYEDPEAVVELTLSNADITCTVAPAILFLNTYECDGNWSADEAKPDVDTSAAGANLILEGKNTVNGSYVAKIFKDKDGEKKLWKQDGAIYSYMSLNIWGNGSLDLTAGNEGLDTELHLTINGGNLNIYSDNDGINTNEDGVSVTTINAGNLHITAGLGAEGDGIDSNGYLVINGGTVISSANPAADAGLDSDLGSYINGGTVIALGSTMDWAESASGQVTMNLQFAEYQDGSSAIIVTGENETPVFAYNPSEDEALAQHTRQYRGAIISCAQFKQGKTYHLYSGGTITGEEAVGIYSVVSAYDGSVQMQYTGTDLRGHGGMGGHPTGEMPQLPEGETFPEDWKPADGAREFPGGSFTPPEGETMPADFAPGQFGGQPPEGSIEGMTPPEDFAGEMPKGAQPGSGNPKEIGMPTGKTNTEFYMNDMVNAFSGIQAANR